MTDTGVTGSSEVSLASAVPAGEAVALENEFLCVTMWLRQGGKLVSILAQTAQGPVELLHPPLQAYSTATDSSGFASSDAGGWDECFPSVAACTWNGIAIPDHGDVWRRPWQVVRDEQSSTASVSASVDAFSVPIRFSKRLTLAGNTLQLAYTAENTGSKLTEFLWSAHPLFQVEEGDHILLPGNVAAVHVEGSTIAGLAGPDGRCAWPMAEIAGDTWLDLSQVGPPDGRTAHKLFAGRLTSGWCGIYRSRLQLGILMRSDPALTPYAGLWISHAQWPEGGARRQYTVALEPTIAPCDALDKASAMGCSRILLPGASCSWPMHVCVSTSVTYESFLAEANASADLFTAGT